MCGQYSYTFLPCMRVVGRARRLIYNMRNNRGIGVCNILGLLTDRLLIGIFGVNLISN